MYNQIDHRIGARMRPWLLIMLACVSLSCVGCVERIVEPADVFGHVKQGENYSPASTMIDDWYAVEAIDAQTFAINEPKSSQYNTSYLIVGETRAIMFDAGSGERPVGSQSMRDVAVRYTSKPITLILSHFHYDHIHDAEAFSHVILLDRPEIRSDVTGGSYRITRWESLGTDRILKHVQLIADGDMIDLGGRQIDLLNLPGHATESVVLLDHNRNQIFTGDFVYRHLGGIIAFAPGADLTAYTQNSARLLQLTNADTQFFGAHGIPRFGRDWLNLLDSELQKIVQGEATYRYATHYLAPAIPWRVYEHGDMYIYTTPLVDPLLFWSKWMLLVFVTVSLLLLYMLYGIICLPFAPAVGKRA